MLTGKTIDQLSPIDQVYSDLNMPSEYDGFTYKVSFDQLRKSVADYITGVTPSATATIPVTPTPSTTPCVSKCRQYTITNSGPNQAIVQYIDCDGLYQFLPLTGNSITTICSSIFPDYSYTPDPSGDYVFDVSAGTCCFASTPTPTPTPTATPTTTPTPTPNLGLLLRDCCNQDFIGYLSPSIVSQSQLSQGVYYFNDLFDLTGSTISGGCYSLEFGNTVGLLMFTGFSNVSSFVDCQTCLNLTGNYLDCSSCPTGYTWSPYTGTTCISIDITGSTPTSGTGVPIVAVWDDYLEIDEHVCGYIQPWNFSGSVIYDSGYDINGNGTYQALADPGTGLWLPFISYNWVAGNYIVVSPIVRSGIWLSVDNPPVFQNPSTWSYLNSTEVVSRWFGITDTIQSTGQTFYVGLEGPSYCFRLNGQTIIQTDFVSDYLSNNYVNIQQDRENDNQYKWKVYPIYFPSGNNVIEVLCSNIIGSTPRPVFGCEIYQNTYQELTSFTAFTQLNVVFSTINRALRIVDYPIGFPVPSINCFDTIYPICNTLDYNDPIYNINLYYVDCDAPIDSSNNVYQGSMVVLSANTSGTTSEMLFGPSNWYSNYFISAGNFTINPPDTGFTNYSVSGYSCPSGYYYDGTNNICIRISYCEGQQTTGTTCVTPTPTPTPLPPTPTPTSYSGVCSIVCSSVCGTVTATTNSYVNGYPSYSFVFPTNPQSTSSLPDYTIQWDGVKWVLLQQWGGSINIVAVLISNNQLPIGSTTQWIGNGWSNICVMDTGNFYTYGLYNNCPTPTPSVTPTVTPSQTSCFGCREWYYNNQNAFDVTLYSLDCYSGQQSTILSAFTTGYTNCILNNPWHSPLPPNSSLVLLPTGDCCGVTPTPTPTPTVTPTETNKG